MKYLSHYIFVLIVFLLGIGTVLPLFHSGFFSMHDDTQIPRMYEMGKALSDGQFPVRWVRDLGYGYGYPLFNFYAPLPYYIGGILILFGVNALFATKLVFGFAILFSSITMYIFLKKFLSISSAVVGSLLYIYFPYHAVNIYVRGDLGEIFSYSLLPLVFLALYTLHHYDYSKKKIPYSSLILSSLSLSGLLISHILSGYMMLLLFGIFILISLAVSNYKKKLLISYGIILLVTFFLSSFYLLPALFEMRYTNVASQIGGGAAFRDHFVCPFQLWNSPWGYGGSTKGCVDGLSFGLGKFNIFLLLMSIASYLPLFFKRKVKKTFIFFSSLFLLVFCVFMLLEISIPLWQLLPNAEFLQYPWRFLNFVGFFMAVVCAVGFNSLLKIIPRPLGNVIIGSSVGGIIFSALIGWSSFSLLPTGYFYIQNIFQPQKYYALDSAFYTDTSYINWNVSRISDEYLPKQFVPPKVKGDLPVNRIQFVNGDGQSTVLIDSSTQLKAQLVTKQASTVLIHKASFPWLHILLNGKDVSYNPTIRGIEININKGEYVLQILYRQTAVEVLSNSLSLIGIIVILIGIIKIKKYGTQAS